MKDKGILLATVAYTITWLLLRRTMWHSFCISEKPWQ